MEAIYNDYLKNMRNLVKEFIEDYRDVNFNDGYKSANEFLLNYSFGKFERGQKILDLEEKYQNSLDKIMGIERAFEESFKQ
jgi:hypothetical protein